MKICGNDVIGCGGVINQSDFVGLCGSTWVYAGLHRGLCGSMLVYAEVYMGLRGLHGGLLGGYMGAYVGLGNIIQSKSVPVMSLSIVRSIKCPPLFVPGYH